MKIIYDDRYRYVATFDETTGFSVRSGILTKEGIELDVDPFMASFPELLDIGIMGHCTHGLSGRCLSSGVQCYQSGAHVSAPNMLFERFKSIIDEVKGRTFQVALGGRGDPDQHEAFMGIIRYARENGVVPNFTTSGLGLHKVQLPAIKRFCGAVAVSFYRSDYTDRAIEQLSQYGIKTNLHYVLSKTTIEEAIFLLKKGHYLDKVNRIIFLLHKPVGLGTAENVLTLDHPLLSTFLNLVMQPELASKCGFDSCSVPALLAHSDKLLPESVEPCEASRFSAYISPDFRMYPCSFEQNIEQSVDLSVMSIEAGWYSYIFKNFRKRFEGKCEGCSKRALCYGGCPILPEITLCQQLAEERREKLENKN